MNETLKQEHHKNLWCFYINALLGLWLIAALSALIRSKS